MPNVYASDELINRIFDDNAEYSIILNIRSEEYIAYPLSIVGNGNEYNLTLKIHHDLTKRILSEFDLSVGFVLSYDNSVILKKDSMKLLSYVINFEDKKINLIVGEQNEN